MRLGLVLLLMVGVEFALFAQENDTIPAPVYQQDSVIGFRELETPLQTETLKMEKPEHDPAKAALYSAILPGLGQAYNRKYWKIPLVWAGMGTFAYFINWNNDRYQFYRRELIFKIENNPDFPNTTLLDASTLKSARDSFRRNRDLLIIFNVFFYMLNIVDAHVDAHLIEFDVNQDLTVQVLPSIQPTLGGNSSTGLSLTFRF